MRFWIKLYIDLLDDIQFGLLPEYLKWRAIELSLVAGENGDDGLLPPVERLAWRLRLAREKLEETLSVLSQAGAVHETPQGWVVADFKKNQSPLSSTERSRNSRLRSENAANRCNNRNEAEGADSTSTSASDSPEGEGDTGEGKPLPVTPSEAAEDPDIIIFLELTGRLPANSQYQAVTDTLRYIRKKRNLTYETAITVLKPYWLAWSNRRRRDGSPYDPSSLVWLTEWALNETIPPERAAREPPRTVPSVEETRRRLDERDAKSKQAVPPPEYIQEQMRQWKEKLRGRR
jgi:hypothetical protein